MIGGLEFVKDLKKVCQADLRNIRPVEMVERFWLRRWWFERIKLHIHGRRCARGQFRFGEVVCVWVG